MTQQLPVDPDLLREQVRDNLGLAPADSPVKGAVAPRVSLVDKARLGLHERFDGLEFPVGRSAVDLLAERARRAEAGTHQDEDPDSKMSGSANRHAF